MDFPIRIPKQKLMVVTLERWQMGTDKNCFLCRIR